MGTLDFIERQQPSGLVQALVEKRILDAEIFFQSRQTIDEQRSASGDAFDDGRTRGRVAQTEKDERLRQEIVVVVGRLAFDALHRFIDGDMKLKAVPSFVIKRFQ